MEKTYTDAAGRFAFTHIAPGSYRLETSHAQYACNTTRRIELGAAEELNDLEFPFVEGSPLAVELVDSEGAPIAGAAVCLEATDRAAASQRYFELSNAQGQLGWRSLVPGEYVLSVYATRIRSEGPSERPAREPKRGRSGIAPLLEQTIAVSPPQSATSQERPLRLTVPR